RLDRGDGAKAVPQWMQVRGFQRRDEVAVVGAQLVLRCRHAMRHAALPSRAGNTARTRSACHGLTTQVKLTRGLLVEHDLIRKPRTLSGIMLYCFGSCFCLPRPKLGLRCLQASTSCGSTCGRASAFGRGGVPCTSGRMQSTIRPLPSLTAPCLKPACSQAARICRHGLPPPAGWACAAKVTKHARAAETTSDGRWRMNVLPGVDVWPIRKR